VLATATGELAPARLPAPAPAVAVAEAAAMAADL